MHATTLQGYNYVLCYCPGKKWPSQIHFHISDPNLALRLHWILPSTMPTYPLSKRKPSNWLLRWMPRCMHWMISSPYTNHTKASQKHSCLPMVVSSGLVSAKAIEEAVQQCEICMRFQAQNAATPPTPTPTPSCPWLICALDIFTLDGMDYLILADFYSKVILVHNLPAGQSNSAKVIHILEEWFCDHGTTEVLCTNNGSQYASAAFAVTALNGVSPMKPPANTTHSSMDLLSHVSK